MNVNRLKYFTRCLIRRKYSSFSNSQHVKARTKPSSQVTLNDLEKYRISIKSKIANGQIQNEDENPSREKIIWSNSSWPLQADGEPGFSRAFGSFYTNSFRKLSDLRSRLAEIKTTRDVTELAQLVKVPKDELLINPIEFVWLVNFCINNFDILFEQDQVCKNDLSPLAFASNLIDLFVYFGTNLTAISRQPLVAESCAEGFAYDFSLFKGITPQQVEAFVENRLEWILTTCALPLLTQFVSIACSHSEAAISDCQRILAKVSQMLTQLYTSSNTPAVRFARIELAINFDRLKKKSPEALLWYKAGLGDTLQMLSKLDVKEATPETLQALFVAMYGFGRSGNLDACFTLFKKWHEYPNDMCKAFLVSAYIDALLFNMSISGALRIADLNCLTKSLPNHVQILEFLQKRNNISHMITVFDSLTSRQIPVVYDGLCILLNSAIANNHKTFAIEVLEHAVLYSLALPMPITNTALHYCIEQRKFGLALQILKRTTALDELDMDVVEALLQKLIIVQDQEMLRELVNILLECFRKQAWSKTEMQPVLFSMARGLSEKLLLSLLRLTQDAGVMLVCIFWCDKLRITLDKDLVEHAVSVYIKASRLQNNKALQNNWEATFLLYQLTFSFPELGDELGDAIAQRIAVSSSENGPNPQALKRFLDSLQNHKAEGASPSESLFSLGIKLLQARGSSKEMSSEHPETSEPTPEDPAPKDATKAMPINKLDIDALTKELDVAIKEQKRYVALMHYEKFRAIAAIPPWRTLVNLMQFLGAKCPTRNDYGSALQIFDYLVDVYAPQLQLSKDAKACLLEAYKAASVASIANDDFENFAKLANDHLRILGEPMPLSSVCEILSTKQHYSQSHIEFVLEHVQQNLDKYLDSERRVYLPRLFVCLLNACEPSAPQTLSDAIVDVMKVVNCSKTAEHYLALLKLKFSDDVIREYLDLRAPGPASPDDIQLLNYILSTALASGQNAEQISALVTEISSPKYGVEPDAQLWALLIRAHGRVGRNLVSAAALLEKARLSHDLDNLVYCALIECQLHWALKDAPFMFFGDELAAFLRQEVQLDGEPPVQRMALLSRALETYRCMLLVDKLPVNQSAADMIVVADSMLGNADRAAHFRVDIIRKHNLSASIKAENALIRGFIAKNKLISALAVFDGLSAPGLAKSDCPVRNRESWEIIREGVRVLHSHASSKSAGYNLPPALERTKSSSTPAQLLAKYDLKFIQERMKQEL